MTASGRQVVVEAVIPRNLQNESDYFLGLLHLRGDASGDGVCGAAGRHGYPSLPESHRPFDPSQWDPTKMTSR